MGGVAAEDEEELAGDERPARTAWMSVETAKAWDEIVAGIDWVASAQRTYEKAHEDRDE